MSDKIVSRPGNQKYRDEYDRIFGVKSDESDLIVHQKREDLYGPFERDENGNILY
jgi:hypothetical protein